MKLSQLIDVLQRIETDAFDPFDPEVRIIGLQTPDREVALVELDGNGYVYISGGDQT